MADYPVATRRWFICLFVVVLDLTLVWMTQTALANGDQAERKREIKGDSKPTRTARNNAAKHGKQGHNP